MTIYKRNSNLQFSLVCHQLAVVLLLVAATALHAQNLDLGVTNGQPGTIVEVPMSLSPTGNAVGLQVDIGYYGDVLTLIGATGSAGLADHVITTGTPFPGILRIVLYSASNAEINPGEVIRVSFSINPDAVPQISGLPLMAATLGDINANLIALDPVDGGAVVVKFGELIFQDSFEGP
jgi:hypothetical protein